MKPILQIIIDTNVFVSGIFWSGIPYKILKAWQDRGSNPSPRVFGEYEIFYGIKKFDTLINRYFELSINEIYKASSKNFYGHEEQCFYTYLLGCLASHISDLLPRIKHDSYKEEHEYRLIEVEFVNKEQNKRCKIHIPNEKRIWSENNILMPFRNTIPRTISDQFDHDCISKIWVGPGLNFKHAKHDINELLKQYGYKDVEIIQSDIPYRSKK